MKALTALLLIFIVVGSFFIFNYTSAGFGELRVLEGGGDIKEGGGDPKTSGTQLKNPLPSNDPAVVANTIIKYVLGLTGVLAIIAFVWGGIEWMISGGAPERIKKGKTMIVWAILGLVVIFGSYAILDVVFKALGV